MARAKILSKIHIQVNHYLGFISLSHQNIQGQEKNTFWTKNMLLSLSSRHYHQQVSTPNQTDVTLIRTFFREKKLNTSKKEEYFRWVEEILRGWNGIQKCGSFIIGP